MTRMVAFSNDIIPYAQATLANPSGDGVTFLMEDKAGSTWEMEAVRKSDGSIRGFKVGEECPYYESEGWTYANLHKNNLGEYAVLESWESAVDDFTFVWDFAEFGTQEPQEGKDYWDESAFTWEAYFYKPNSGTDNYGYFVAYDDEFQDVEYYDALGAFCVASFNNSGETSVINIQDPFNACPYVDQGWTSGNIT